MSSSSVVSPCSLPPSLFVSSLSSTTIARAPLEVLSSLLSVGLEACPGFGTVCIRWVGGSIEDGGGTEDVVSCLGLGVVCVGGGIEDEACFSWFLAFLLTSGSPFSSKRSVGRRLRGPKTMLGSDKSRMASDLSSDMGNVDELAIARLLVGMFVV